MPCCPGCVAESETQTTVPGLISPNEPIVMRSGVRRASWSKRPSAAAHPHAVGHETEREPERNTKGRPRGTRWKAVNAKWPDKRTRDSLPSTAFCPEQRRANLVR